MATKKILLIADRVAVAEVFPANQIIEVHHAIDWAICFRVVQIKCRLFNQ